MKLYETSENYKLLVFDLETVKCYFLASFYNPDIEKWLEFEISEYKNDLYSLMKFYDVSNIDFAIGYNNLGFDAQVMHFIQLNYETWFDKTSLEITNLIYEFVQNLIENQKYNNRLPYYESQFQVKQLDCFTILGLNGEARYTSLKALQFRLKWHNVETMSIHHSTENISLKDIENVKSYCRNDILSTYEVFKLVLGNTDDELYKGKNLLSLRNDTKEEFELDCINYSDIKIGDELMKHSYLKKIKKSIKDLPKKGTFRKYIKLSECIPDYIEFKTPILQKLLLDTKRKKININDKHEVNFKYGKLQTEYVIGLGGGHSKNENQIFIKNDNNELIDLDIQSLYPAIICNENYYPAHLGKELLVVFKSLYDKRISLKPLAKKDAKIKGIVEAIKLILNSFYGKVGSIVSWAYDKKVAYSVCLTGQFNLLMLIEEMELNGIYCFMFNTDGATFIVDNSKKEKFYEIWKWFEEKTKLLLEETKFNKMIFASVNDYLAITTDNKYKFKGTFVSDVELYKNPSKRIIPLALQQYFINGVKPEDFISNHKDILDFCIRGKANSSTSLFLKYDNGESKDVGSLIRYYLIKDKNAPQLFKIGTGTKDNDIDSNQNAPNELGIQRVKLFNKIVDGPYNIDYEQYIYQTYKIIAKIEKNKKDLNYVDSILNKEQFKLF
jgi:hypothetical protein